MGKKSATSLTSSSPPSLWRRYRLALVIISLLVLTWLLFDHQSLTLEDQVEYVIKEFHKIFPADGLLPIYLDPHTGTTSKSKITFGALGDRSEARAACDAAEYCAETQDDAGSLGRGRTACRLFKQLKPDMRVLQAMLHRIIEDG
ncbi:hypothetical protein ACLB2K_038177 [Fragaria x ananassa]